ncbi:MAG: 4-dihydromethyl-trisporate dehydrogenase [Planctomyces sp.]|nr:4-dihydromethyl-trisporate dehydrogenase [Planctomyces sp.]
MTDNIQLASGSKLPSIGLGLWKIAPDDVAPTITSAIDIGYRHFDSACDYGNEAEVGNALQQVLQSGKVKRDDLWITSKLWNTYHRAEHVRPALEKALSDLQLDYLDLYLIHFPISLQFIPFDKRYPPGWVTNPDEASPHMEPVAVPIRETWEAMQELKEAGLVKEIGVCNFNCALLRDLLSYAKIPPAVLQVEMHPLLTQEKLLRFCRENDIAVTAFSPLGALSYFSIGMAAEGESLLDREVIKQIAADHQCTPAQIILRWGVQRGTAIVPKSTHPDRLRENFSLFDFELTEDEMATINNLNENRRFNDPGKFGEEAFNTFMPIYE